MNVPRALSLRPSRTGAETVKPSIRLLLVPLLVLAATVGDAAAEEKTDELTEMIRQAQEDPSDERYLALLERARALNRPYAVLGAVKAYTTKGEVGKQLLAAAADNAYRAGEYELAMRHLKRYIADAQPGAETGRQVAKFYDITIHLLDNPTAAFNHMVRTDLRYRRGSPEVRRYDAWFLKQARRHNDWVNLAVGLRVMVQDEPTEGFKHEVLRPLLRQGLEAMRYARPEAAAAVEEFRTVIGQAGLSQGEVRAGEFHLAAFEYRRLAKLEGPKEAAELLPELLSAARAYIQAARSAAAVHTVVETCGTGDDPGRWDDRQWGEVRVQVAGMLVKAMADLPEEVQLAALDRRLDKANSDLRYELGTPRQLLAVGAESGAFVAHRGQYEFDRWFDESKEIGPQIKNYRDLKPPADSDIAMVLRALDAGDSFEKVAAHHFGEESWEHDDARIFLLFDRVVEPAFRHLEGGTDREARRKAVSSADWMAAVGRPWLAKSPLMAFQPHAAKAYFDHAWHAESDKLEVKKHIDAVAWVPFSSRQVRDEGHGLRNVRKLYDDWHHHKRREMNDRRTSDEKKKAIKAELKRAEPIRDMLEDVRRGKNFDVDAAPDELAKAYAIAVSNRDDAKAFAAAVETIAGAMKGYDEKKIPFARLYFDAVLYPIGRDDHCTSEQKEALDVLVAGDDLGFVDQQLERFVRTRDRWPNRIRKEHREDALAFNSAVGDSLIRLMEDGRFSSRQWDLFIETRRGDHWTENKAREDVLATAIETGALARRYEGENRTWVTEAMRLVQREFPELKSKFPVATWFDDKYIAGMKAKKLVDPGYWENGGKDEKGAVAKAAAKILASYERTPVVPGTPSHRYSPGDLQKVSYLVFVDNADKIDPQSLSELESHFGNRYGFLVNGDAYFERKPDLGDDQARVEFFKRLKAVVERLQGTPYLSSHPNMAALAQVSGSELNDSELSIMVKLVRDLTRARWQGQNGSEILCSRLAEGLVEHARLTDLNEVVPHLWSCSRDLRNLELQNQLRNVTTELIGDDGSKEAAAAIAVAGLTVADDELNDAVRRSLESIKGTVVASLGAGEIPVRKGDPAYPVYLAQQQFHSGIDKGAWATFRDPEHAAGVQLPDMLGKVDPGFTLWAIRNYVDRGLYEEADRLLQAVLIWLDDPTNTHIDNEMRARFEVAYADLSAAQKNYAVARAQYLRIVENPDYQNTRSQLLARLRMADVSRQQRNFDEAQAVLEELETHNDEWARARAKYYLALVKLDLDETKVALRLLEESIDLDRDNEIANIKLGEVQGQVGMLRAGTDIELTAGHLRDRIVPGEPLKVKLKDKNRVLSGRATSIELRVWTDETKDEEILLLAQLGDNNQLFEGIMDTVMLPVERGDGIIQVVGNDKIHFDFSDDFKRLTNYQGRNMEQVLRVLSDANLYASSGYIETEEERRERELREKLLGAQRQRGNDNWEEGAAIPKLSEVRPGNQVRPGNDFNVWLLDLDRNYTKDIDKILVQARTSSGDSVERIVLLETEAFSGEFKGKVETAKRPAYAVASDVSTGEPNAVISPSDTFDPWIGSTTSDGPRHFTVDLNDLVELGKMDVLVGDPERATKKLIVQTSLNNRNFQTVGAWPFDFAPWTGDLQVDLVPSDTGMPATYQEIVAAFDVEHLDPSTGRVRLTPSSGTMQLEWEEDLKEVWGEVTKHLAKEEGDDRGRNRRRRGSGGETVLVRMRGAFWVPERVTRSFYVMSELGGREGRSRPSTVPPRIYIDGELVNDPRARRRDGSGGGQHQGWPVKLVKGLHSMEVIYAVPKGGGELADVTIKGNTQEPPYTAVLPAQMWDIGGVPQVIRDEFVPARATVAADTEKNLAIDFAGHSTRSIRLWLMDYAGDAPQIRKVKLAEPGGERVLPIAEDFTELRENDILEIAPGDRIQVSYQDPHPFDSERTRHQAALTATYYNGEVKAAFPDYASAESGEEPRYYPVRRFEYDDKIKVFILDNDLDTTEVEDRIKLKVKTSIGKETEIEAIETDLHSGTFEATFWPVKGEPQNDGQLQVQRGDDVTFIYQDQENTDPGIPWLRSTRIEQVVWIDPEFRVYDTKSAPLGADEMAMLRESQADLAEANRMKSEGLRGGEILPQYRLIVERPGEPLRAGSESEAGTIVLGGPVIAEVTWPTVCKATNSTVTVYAQTKRGRQLAAESSAGGAGGGEGPSSGFDLDVPGTISMEVFPSNPSVGGGRDGMPDGYLEVASVGTEMLGEAMDDGRFTVSVPIEPGDCPKKSLVGSLGKTVEPEDYKLFVTADDEVYLGFKYTDKAGNEHWIERTLRFAGDAIFDVMDKRYEEHVGDRYVGEKVHLRILDRMRNVSGKKDTVEIEIETATGHSATVELFETLSHSGIFQGHLEFVHGKDQDALEHGLNTIPVTYGDTVTLRYTAGGNNLVQNVAINKGFDGEVLPFTKRFKDPDIAMRTVFSIAEAYFEMAKKHRALAEDAIQRNEEKDADRLEQIARREIKQGRKLLNEAIRDFPENEIRAQADYLRAELSLELANDTDNPKFKDEYYRQALFLFGEIVANHRDTEYGPKALFKKGMVYEKMGKMDLASAEYVKLSYTYPRHELIADTIARLGGYFFRRAKDKHDQAKETDDELDKAELNVAAREDFVTAGQVFSKLRHHFPEHELADQTTVAAGTCMMWGHDWSEAQRLLKVITEGGQHIAPATKAEAFYWLGYTYIRMGEEGIRGDDDFEPGVEAYKILTRLTLEYPETEWAKKARGLMLESEYVKPPER